MERLIDWNCKLIPSPFDPHATVADTARALQHLHALCGCCEFLMLSEWNMEHESVRAHEIRCFQWQKELAEAIASPLKIKYATAVHLTPSLWCEKDLDRLTIGSQNHLPLLLPLSAYEDWIDAELNALLFQRHFRLMLLSFDYAAILYEKHVLEKLMRIPHAVYQFDIKALQLPTVCEVIRTLLRQNATVVLGSGLTHPQKAFSYTTATAMEVAVQHLSYDELQTLLRGGQRLWASIHSPVAAR